MRGNKSKGWRAFNGSRPVPAAEGAGTLTALTPQVPPPSADEMADVDGTPKLTSRRSPPRGAASHPLTTRQARVTSPSTGATTTTRGTKSATK